MTSDCQPRTKNGQPAHSTTGRRQQHLDPVRGLLATMTWSRPVRCPPISSATTGRVRTSPIQNRRVMSISSGFGPASALTSTGSSAMPQIGHEPGPDLPDLGMHRAGVDGAFRHGLGLGRRDCRVEIARRIGHELRRGSRPSRNSRAGRCARRGAWRCADRRTSRTPGLSPDALRQFPPQGDRAGSDHHDDAHERRWPCWAAPAQHVPAVAPCRAFC